MKKTSVIVEYICQDQYTSEMERVPAEDAKRIEPSFSQTREFMFYIVRTGTYYIVR